jgi:hypothetical protein
MRRASRQRTARAHTTSSTPSAQSSLSPASLPHCPSPLNSAPAIRDYGIESQATADPPATEVILSPSGTFITEQAGDPETDERAIRHRQLAIAIRQRIESRLAGRVRELSVRIKGNTIILDGKCSTYYTKQLAQHAALGALEDEQLENAIVVEVPR